MTTHPGWDARGYDDRFSFVTAYGTDLLELLAAESGERILDIGCGTGHQCASLAAAGVDVLGVDADSAMIESAQLTYPPAVNPRTRFVVGDAQDLDLDVVGIGYDAVVSNAALHWMPAQDAVIAGMARVLRPGGRVVVEMGGAGNVARLTEAIRAGRAAIGIDPAVLSSWTFPSPGEQAARLERHGFTVRLVRLFDRMTPLSEGDSAADWAAMFGAGLLADVPAAARPDFDDAIDSHARSLGLATRPDGLSGWWADYVRLRFVAELL